MHCFPKSSLVHSIQDLYYSEAVLFAHMSVSHGPCRELSDATFDNSNSGGDAA